LRPLILIEVETKVAFADVAGVEDAKMELKEVVEYHKNPKGYARLGAHIPKGVLLGRSVRHRQDPAGGRGSGEAGVKFFSMSGPISWKYLSASAPHECATCSSRPRQQMPAIIFIDELDALGGDRGDIVYGGINAIEAMTFTTGRVRRQLNPNPTKEKSDLRSALRD
jgi:cell division protease FtsH